MEDQCVHVMVRPSLLRLLFISRRRKCASILSFEQNRRQSKHYLHINRHKDILLFRIVFLLQFD